MRWLLFFLLAGCAHQGVTRTCAEACDHRAASVYGHPPVKASISIDYGRVLFCECWFGGEADGTSTVVSTRGCR